MFCEKCKGINADDAKFCMHCGATLSKEAISIDPQVHSRSEATEATVIPYDWILFVSWLIITVLELKISLGQGVVFFIYIALNTIICSLDSAQIKKMGLNSPSVGWALFFVPVYLWKRANVLKRSRAVFYIVLLWMFSPLLFLYFDKFSCTEDVISNVLLENKEVETLKMVIFDEISKKPFGEFVKEFSDNITYKFHKSDGKKYVTVKLVDPRNSISQKIIYFEATPKGELIYFELKEIASSEDAGGNWIIINGQISTLLLETRSIFSITHEELKICEQMFPKIQYGTISIEECKQLLSVIKKLLENSPKDKSGELKELMTKLQKSLM